MAALRQWVDEAIQSPQRVHMAIREIE